MQSRTCPASIIPKNQSLIFVNMAFDRSKYKATPLSTVNETVNETKVYDTFFGGRSDYAPFWKERDGVTIKRVLPAKNPDESPYVPMLTTQLQCEVDKKQDGKVVGKEVVRKKIFLATLHGKYPYDIVEEYIKRVYEMAEQVQDKTEKDRFLAPVTGYRAGGKWVSGIRPTLEYVYYAYIEGKVYRDSLNKRQMEALNRESIDLCAQNDTAAIDMFSDPDTGFPIQWSRGKDANGKTEVVIKALPLKMGQSWEDYYAQNAVPDRALEELEKYPSLKELYVNSYGMKDFQLELDGLKRFDEANQYKIFAQDDYLDMIERLQNMIEEREKASGKGVDDSLPFPNPAVASQSAPAPAKKTVRKTAAKPVGPTREEKLAVVNAEFIRQYGDEYEELDIDGEELEETYALALKKEDLGYDLPHVSGWDTPVEAPQPAPAKKTVRKAAAAPVEAPQPVPEPQEAPASEVEPQPVNAPSDANTPSGMTAIERIRALRAQKQAEAALKK